MECPICLDNIATEVFHNEELHRACKTCYDIIKISNRCPICRQKLSLYPLYWNVVVAFKGSVMANRISDELPKYFNSHSERANYIRSL